MSSLKNNLLETTPTFIALKPENNEGKVPNYLIEKSGNRFIIHRQLQWMERTYYESDRIMAHEKELYLKNIKTYNSLNDATCFVAKLWNSKVKFISFSEKL